MITVFRVCELVDWAPMYGGHEKLLFESKFQEEAVDWMHKHCKQNPPDVAVIKTRYASEENRRKNFSFDHVFVAANYF